MAPCSWASGPLIFPTFLYKFFVVFLGACHGFNKRIQLKGIPFFYLPPLFPRHCSPPPLFSVHCSLFIGFFVDSWKVQTPEGPPLVLGMVLSFKRIITCTSKSHTHTPDCKHRVFVNVKILDMHLALKGNSLKELVLQPMSAICWRKMSGSRVCIAPVSSSLFWFQPASQFGRPAGFDPFGRPAGLGQSGRPAGLGKSGRPATLRYPGRPAALGYPGRLAATWWQKKNSFNKEEFFLRRVSFQKKHGFKK